MPCRVLAGKSFLALGCPKEQRLFGAVHTRSASVLPPHGVGRQTFLAVVVAFAVAVENTHLGAGMLIDLHKGAEHLVKHAWADT